jgi:1-acyl-sn-glycerol-3-phosphate acyltransferase
MWILIAVIRTAVILSLLLLALVLSLIIGLLPRSIRLTILRMWYRAILYLIGVRCQYYGESIETVKTVALVVSNHISWADIIVIGAHWPFIFLAMQDVARWPVVGWLSRRVGTLFIERGKGAPGAIVQVARVLVGGEHVVLFPEGRTTLGLSVGRFQPRIFQSAVDAGVPVQPLAIYYQDSHRASGEASRISFATDHSFLHSVWRTLCGPPINAEIRVFPQIGPMNNRQQLATIAEKQVAKHIEDRKNPQSRS